VIPTDAAPHGGSLRGGGWGEPYLRLSTVIVKAISIFVLAFMVVINAVNITSRALLNVDNEWTQEVSMIAAMVLYFFSITLVAKQRGDIRMDFFARSLPMVWQRALDLFARLVVLVFQSAVLWLSIVTLQFVGIFQTPVLELPESVFYIPVIVGAADFLLTELIYTVRTLQGMRCRRLA
jgi:TRAP-type transport system small permease protein